MKRIPIAVREIAKERITMPARNAKQWETVPGKLSSGEYVDSRIYSDREIFEEETIDTFLKT